MTGSVKLNTPSAGSVTLSPADTASNVTVTIPASTATLVNASSTQTLTNKTLTAAGGNAVEATSGPTSTQLAGMRNKIINGAMMIDQRNAGTSVAPSVEGYTLDRWFASLTQASKYSVQQSSDAPSGFSNSVLITSTSSYSVGNGDTFPFAQHIEGFNSSDLKFGTADASTITLSFWVKSSLTGTFGGAITNSAVNRSYPFSYSVSSANTWTKVSVSIAGDTSGTWVGATNGIGLRVRFGLGSGSNYSGTANTWASANYIQPTSTVSVVGTAGATWQVTGVQLEKGATATPFENRLYGTELALCQRYYETGQGSYQANVTSGSNYGNVAYFKITKRATPTMVYTAVAQSGFPTSAPIDNGTTVESCIPYKTANATASAAYFTYTYTASSEL